MTRYRGCQAHSQVNICAIVIQRIRNLAGLSMSCAMTVEEFVANLFMHRSCRPDGNECCVQRREAQGTRSARGGQVHDLEVVRKNGVVVDYEQEKEREKEDNR